MGVLKFSDSFVESHPETYQITDYKLLNKLVYYIINSKYRKSVKLIEWLKKQVETPSEQLLNVVNQINSYKDYDLQIHSILQWVRTNFKYKGDVQTWGMNEYWATANESIEKLYGDCEDGAILMYVLARLKGVPANRLYIFAGNVEYMGKTAGHCWLGYKPKNYPMNFVWMDWCYYYSSNSVNSRNKNSIQGQNIMCWNNKGEPINSKYKNIWFAFNEQKSFREIK